MSAKALIFLFSLKKFFFSLALSFSFFLLILSTDTDFGSVLQVKDDMVSLT